MARSILDIIDHTESLNLSGILLFIDFEKAFDSIEWDFLYQSLEAFNFDLTLIRWIKTFYNNVSSCVINNRLFPSPLKELRHGSFEKFSLNFSSSSFVIRVNLLHP